MSPVTFFGWLTYLACTAAFGATMRRTRWAIRFHVTAAVFAVITVGLAVHPLTWKQIVGCVAVAAVLGGFGLLAIAGQFDADDGGWGQFQRDQNRAARSDRRETQR